MCCIERQKADRRLKQATRTLRGCDDESKKDALQQKVHVAQVDLNYALYHPLLLPYKALFRTKPDSPADKVCNEEEDGDLAGRQKSDIWLRVESATKAGEAALKALRNEGEPASGAKAKSNAPGGKQSKKVQQHHRSRKEDELIDEEDGSDDNFFE